MRRRLFRLFVLQVREIFCGGFVKDSNAKPVHAEDIEVEGLGRDERVKTDH